MDSLFSFRKKPSQKQILIVVPHTHWDREWYKPFQEFRVQLIHLIDLLLTIMERDTDYRHFTLDGQTVVLEDYLKIRPDHEAQLRKLIEEGRILVGPWYVIPDEFLVSGEALIRNLLLGHQIGQRMGQVMKVGYLPDPFGHIAQLPQILRGFDIDSALLWRGVGGQVKNSEFIWRAPDGSEILVIYPPLGYNNLPILPSSTPQLLETIKGLRQSLTPYATTEYLLILIGDDHLEPQSNLPALITEANQRLKDAELIQGTIPLLVERVREAAAREGVSWSVIEGELRSSELSHILAGVLSTRMYLKQRNAAVQTLLTKWAEPFSVFARLLANDNNNGNSNEQAPAPAWEPLLRLAWKYLLQNHAHDSISGCSADAVDQDMVSRFDWSQQIAETVVRQTLGALALKINTKAIQVPKGYQAIDHTANESPEDSNPGYIVVFNAESGPRTDFVEATVQLPPGGHDIAIADHAGHLMPYQVLRERQSDIYSATVGREQVQGYLRMAGFGGDWPAWKIRILEGLATRVLGSRLPLASMAVAAVEIRPSTRGRTIDITVEMTSGKHNYEVISRALKQISVLVGRGEVRFFRVRVIRRDEVDIGFIAQDIPGHGYRGFQILTGHRRHAEPPPSQDSAIIENEFLSIQADTINGQLTMVDKDTGLILENLNTFVDGADAGDEYTYSPPAEDLIIDEPCEPPAISVIENGPSRATLLVKQRYLLPESLAADRQARAANLVPVPITSYISLYPGVKRVDIHTELENVARDHRLRVLIPTGIQSQQAEAEGHFAVIARPIEAALQGDESLEQPVNSYPQGAFVDVSDGEVGVMVANRGLPEYEVIPGEQGTVISLTLVRAIGWLARDDLLTREGAAGPVMPTPGAQSLGKHVFEYAILPHEGNWENAFRLAHWYANPLRARRSHSHSGSLPPAGSFINIQPAAVVTSAVKPAEDGQSFILRLFNLTATPVTARVAIFVPLKKAIRVNMNEEHIADLTLNDPHTLQMPLRGHEIVTLRLDPLTCQLK